VPATIIGTTDDDSIIGAPVDLVVNVIGVGR
jgi:hypothetical protein